MRPDPTPLTFRYRFGFPDGNSHDFVLKLDRRTLALQVPPRPSYPDWTRLSHQQCVNCPLKEADSPRCPIAENLVDVIAFFRDRLSYEDVEVEVITHGRSYRKRAALQEGLSSLLGIVMVSSGCPVLNKLRPMVATHLPFMSSEESTYRIISMYLMAQYFIARSGGAPDWDLKGLLAFLEEARQANSGFVMRLKSLGLRDASLNALSILNAQGEIVSLRILQDDLERWRRVFMANFPPPPPAAG